MEGDLARLLRGLICQGRPNAGERAEEVLKKFSRLPTWMWANEEVEALAEWLHRLPDRERFYAPWGHRAIGVVYHPVWELCPVGDAASL